MLAAAATPTPAAPPTPPNQILDDNIRFSSLTVQINDLEDGKPITDVFLRLYSQTLQCEQPSDSVPFAILAWNPKEPVTFQNLVAGYQYTIIVMECIQFRKKFKEHYQEQQVYLNQRYAPACAVVTATYSDQSIIIGLVKKLENPLTIKLVLQWKGDINLNLMATYTTKDEISCYAGGNNIGCPGIKLAGSANIRIMTINTLYGYEYLTFVQQMIDQSQLDKYRSDQLENQVPVNSDFLTSEATITVYVHEREFPVTHSSIPNYPPLVVPYQQVMLPDQPYDAPVQALDTPIWLNACINGAESDIVQNVDKFWVNTNIPDDSLKLLTTSNVPSSSLCDILV